jgi:hypothetical protein
VNPCTPCFSTEAVTLFQWLKARVHVVLRRAGHPGAYVYSGCVQHIASAVLCPFAVCTGSPTLANGTFSCGTNSLVGRVCNVTCSTGYIGTPRTPYAVCQDNSTWSTVDGSCQRGKHLLHYVTSATCCILHRLLVHTFLAVAALASTLK